MKKKLPIFIILFLLFLTKIDRVNAQVATDSATATESSTTSTATSSSTASGSGDLELPDVLPETGSYDILFFFSAGLILIAAGFSGLVSGKQILND